MATRPSPVGPFPPGADPDHYDRTRRRVLWTMPSGLYVIGSAAGGRRNLMTITWVMQVATDPKAMAASVQRDAVTHELIEQGGAFSIMLMSREHRPLVRQFVKPIGEEQQGEGKLAGLAFRDGLSGAPILELALAFVDCRVIGRMDLGSHDIFIGEVVDAGFTAGEHEAVLRMEDTRMSYGG